MFNFVVEQEYQSSEQEFDDFLIFSWITEVGTFSYFDNFLCNSNKIRIVIDFKMTKFDVS